MSDSRTVKASPVTALTMFCPTDRAQMEWHSYKHLWRCGNCGHHVVLNCVFVEVDAAVLIEIGVPLERLHLTAPILALARRTFMMKGDDGTARTRCYVEVPWRLPAVPAESTWSADEEIARIMREKPWMKRAKGASE